MLSFSLETPVSIPHVRSNSRYTYVLAIAMGPGKEIQSSEHKTSECALQINQEICFEPLSNQVYGVLSSGRPQG